MANPEHVEILRQGVDAWNEWREANPNVKPDLRDSNLIETDLREVNLRDADLTRANFTKANLSGGNLVSANLADADLTGANLTGASLHKGYIVGTNLGDTDLTSAYLTNAYFYYAANLWGTNFSESVMGFTTLSELDLRQANGLESVIHIMPSDISISTFTRSHGKIPDVFLRGCGVPEDYIAYMKSLANTEPIQFYQCFISYSHKDKSFTTRLHNDLQAAGVRCWYASHDLQIGDRIWDTIDREIRVRDKLMVVLSENSIQSDWVEDEVNTAYEEERRRDGTVLFPIRLDDSVMDTDEAWAGKVRQRHIGDFRDWTNPDAYKAAFDRLLRDLKAS